MPRPAWTADILSPSEGNSIPARASSALFQPVVLS